MVKSLTTLLEEADYKYKTGIQKLVYKPGQSLIEFVDWDIDQRAIQAGCIHFYEKSCSKHFKHPKLRELMEFPVLFLGALPKDTPALYSLMNYADIKGGTWFPEGGMYSIVEGCIILQLNLVYIFILTRRVRQISVEERDGTIQLKLTTTTFIADVVIGGC